MHDPNDKPWYVEYGKQEESNFVGKLFLHGVTPSLNPQKAYDPFCSDLLLTLPADLKVQDTPFYQAFERYGIPWETAVSLNVDPFLKYEQESPNLQVIFDVRYPQYKAVHVAHLKEIRRAIDHNLAKLHTYKDRDTGNNKQSYILNATWFPKLYPATPSDIEVPAND